MARAKPLKEQSFGLIGMLAVQFILGMILNLFVTLPENHPGNTGSKDYLVRSLHSYGWAITIGGGVALFLHVLVGTGLLIGAITFLVRAIKSQQAAWIWVSAIGLFGIFAAFTNGLAFLDFNHDANSFVMAMGYIVAAVSYSVGLTTPVSQKSKAL